MLTPDQLQRLSDAQFNAYDAAGGDLSKLSDADFMGNASIKKHAFTDGRFAGINMRDDADITYLFYGIFTNANTSANWRI